MTDQGFQSGFGFSERPFSLTPDPDFLFWSQHHRKAFTVLEYGVMSGAPITVLTGEVGAGKTTLIHQLLRTTSDRTEIGLISNAHRDGGSLKRWVLDAFDVTVPEGTDDVAAFRELQDHLLEVYARGDKCILIVDEAQTLSTQQLEELRMLTNVNSGKSELLQLVLAGQPELRGMLRDPALRQFAQRVSVFYHLPNMSESEVEAYIRHRLTKAGGTGNEFSNEAIALIAAETGGVPRLVNKLCDIALVYASVDETKQVTEVLVEGILEDGLILPNAPFA